MPALGQRARRIAFLIIAVASAGCGTDPTATLPLTLGIAGAERKWKDAALRNYSFNSTIYCFCLDEYSGTMRVVVQQGRVTSVVNARTGVPKPLTYRQPVDSLFALLRREVLENPGLLTVTYHPSLGYPTRISYGDQPRDAGAVITNDSLRALP